MLQLLSYTDNPTCFLIQTGVVDPSQWTDDLEYHKEIQHVYLLCLCFTSDIELEADNNPHTNVSTVHVAFCKRQKGYSLPQNFVCPNRTSGLITINRKMTLEHILSQVQSFIQTIFVLSSILHLHLRDLFPWYFLSRCKKYLLVSLICAILIAHSILFIQAA